VRSRRFAGPIAIAILAVFAAPAAADDLSAQCSEPDASSYVQTVMDNSSTGDVVTLVEGSVCNPADAELSEFRLPSHAITLQGNGTGAPEVFDGDSENRTLRGTDVGATVIRNLTFQDAEYSGSGAAIKIQGNSTPTISNIIVIDSESGDGLGDRGPVTIATSDAGGTVRVENSTFGSTEDAGEGNFGISGGGLHLDSEHAIVLAGNTFANNRAETEGGGAVLWLAGRSGAPVTVTDNTFVRNQLARSGEAIYNERLGGGLAIRARVPGTRSVTQSGNRFVENLVVPDIFFPGPKLTRGVECGVYMGGGEYVEAPATTTSDRYVGNVVGFPGKGPSVARGGQCASTAGGGLAFSGELTFTGRNLVAASNVVQFGLGGAIASVDRPVFNGELAARGDQRGTLRVLDSTVVNNGVAFGNGSAIAGDFDDDLVVHNGIVHGNLEGKGIEQISGYNDGGTRQILFTDICEDGASTPVAGEGNICADPDLVDPSTGDVHQQESSPTRDRGSDALVPPDLGQDWEGDARISDSGTDGVRVDMGADELGTVPELEPEPEPGAPPAAQPPAAAPPAQAVQGVQQRRCVSRRAFRIRIRVPRGKKALSATVRVNGKRVRVVRGKRLRAPVRLRGLPKGTFKVRITIRLTNGKRVTGVRTYHTCVPRRPGDGPPKV
jgi:hypothetical protein